LNEGGCWAAAVAMDDKAKITTAAVAANMVFARGLMMNYG